MLDKLKSLFIIEEGGGAKTNQPENGKKPKANISVEKKDIPKSKVAVTTGKSSPTSSKTAAPSGKPDGKFVEVLLKAIEANNLEGFDYLEFKQALQNLSSMSMDEKTKYQSAFAMAKTMGVSSPKLVETANHYIKVLQQEQQKFGAALKNQTQSQVVGKEQELQAMEKEIIKKEKHIEQLQKEIGEHKASLQGRKDAINQAAAKVESTKSNFIYAFNIVANQINSDIENIKKYIK